jgi:nitrogen-specific signal transduction histidine kinase/CheY-like chemotaxis protein
VTRRGQDPADLSALRARLADAEAKLERLQNERVGNEFFTMLAHEFRNPLAPIRSAVEIMRVIGQKDPALEKAREMISRQVDHLSRLVDQLLDVSHITQGTIPLQKEPVDANAVLWRAVELAQPLIEERGQALRVVPLAQPADIEGDFERLVQVVRNLLDNAARYTDARGEIMVSAAKEDDAIAISVKDNGIGIALESLAVIFDLFTQAHRSAERPEGLGIGLSLVRNIVELHGGSVEAKSGGLGHGSEFIVTLPLRTGAMRPGQPAKPASGREMARRIVLIDDNVDAAESLAMLLRLKGHEVHVAYDGPAGVALALKTGPDCVLVDIGLPGIDGYEVAKRLRSHDGGTTLLVALTGYGQNEDRIKSEQAGFDHHLVKPVAQNVLEDLLRER